MLIMQSIIIVSLTSSCLAQWVLSWPPRLAQQSLLDDCFMAYPRGLADCWPERQCQAPRSIESHNMTGGVLQRLPALSCTAAAGLTCLGQRHALVEHAQAPQQGSFLVM